MSSRTVAVVPSLGRSPWAGEAVERLSAELEPSGGEIVWVSPRSAPPPAAGARARLRWVELAAPAGFAAAANRGIHASDGELVALVNDDALVEPGWLWALAAAFDDDARLAAAQGVVADLRAPERCDGCGLGWNRWWQAVQLLRGEPPPGVSTPPFEPFGVSATAALYRRSALETVSTPRAGPFDERLDSWYEDVDLAVRLRAAGFGARTVPSARAVHAGSTTGETVPQRRRRLLARNRILVVMRLLGGRFVFALPRLCARDLADGWRALARGEPSAAGALALGWLAAVASAPRFARLGRPLVSSAELDRLRADRLGAALRTSRATPA